MIGCLATVRSVGVRLFLLGHPGGLKPMLFVDVPKLGRREMRSVCLLSLSMSCQLCMGIKPRKRVSRYTGARRCKTAYVYAML